MYNQNYINKMGILNTYKVFLTLINIISIKTRKIKI